jgi:hypothetical protein
LTEPRKILLGEDELPGAWFRFDLAASADHLTGNLLDV